MIPQTINHSYYSMSDYLLTTYMVMLNNGVVALLKMSMLPSFNLEYCQHVNVLRAVNRELLPQYETPCVILPFVRAV